MAEFPQERQRRVLDAMAASIKSPQRPIADAPLPFDPATNVPQMRPTSPTPFPNVPTDQQMGETAQQQRPYRVGYGAAGLTGVDRLQARRKAMEEAPPDSKIVDRGSSIGWDAPQPRHGLKGKLKSIGEGLLIGLASGDPDNPNNILGSAIGGGGLGAASNQGEAKLRRKFDLNALDNDIVRGLKLEQGQAQLGGMQALQHQRELEPALQAEEIDAKRRIENEKLEVERQKAAGLITKAEADRQQRELDRRSREKIAADRVASNEKIAGMRPSGDESRAAKASAAQAEYDQLVKDEAEAGKQKNDAYAALKTIKENAGYPKDDLVQAQKAAEDADKLYQSFGEKKRDAQRRARENSASSNPLAPPNVTEASVRAEAKRRGQNEDAAVKKARDFGWIQ